MIRRARTFLIFGALLFSAMDGYADDIDELQARMANGPEQCRPDDRLHNYLEYRKCESTLDASSGSKCADEVSRKNAIILKWNSFVRTCRASENRNGGARSAPAADVASKPPPSASTVEHDSEEVIALIQRARQLAESGDIAAARLVLRRAAEAHSAQAALALGAMYDPTVLQQFRIRGVEPDIAEARNWYEKAKEYGSEEAPRRLPALIGR